MLRRLASIDAEGVDTLVAEAELAIQSGDRTRAISTYEKACARGQEYACDQAHKLYTGIGK